MMEMENIPKIKIEKNENRLKEIKTKLKEKFQKLSKDDLNEQEMHISRTPLTFIYKENKKNSSGKKIFYYVYNIDHFKKIDIETRTIQRIPIKNFEIFNYVNTGFMLDESTFIFYDANLMLFEKNDMMLIEYKIKENQVIIHNKTDFMPKTEIEVEERLPLIQNEERITWLNDRLDNEAKNKIKKLQVSVNKEKEKNYFWGKDFFVARISPGDGVLGKNKPKYLILVETQKRNNYSITMGEMLADYKSFLAYPSDEDLSILENQNDGLGIFGGTRARFEPKILVFYQYFLKTKKVKKLFTYLIMAEKSFSTKSVTVYYNYERLGVITVRYLGLKNIRSREKKEICIRLSKRGHLLQKTVFDLDSITSLNTDLPGINLNLNSTELKFSNRNLLFVNNPNLNMFQIIDFLKRKRTVIENNSRKFIEEEEEGLDIEQDARTSQILCLVKRGEASVPETQKKIWNFLNKNFSKNLCFKIDFFSGFAVISCKYDTLSRFDPPLSPIACYSLEEISKEKNNSVKLFVEANTFKSKLKNSEFRLKFLDLATPKNAIYTGYKSSFFTNKDSTVPEKSGSEMIMIRAEHYNLENGEKALYLKEKKFDMIEKKFKVTQHVALGIDLPLRHVYDYTFFNKNNSTRYIPLYQLGLTQNKLFFWDKLEQKVYNTEYDLGGEGIRILIYFDDDLNAYFQTHSYTDKSGYDCHKRIVTHLKLLKEYGKPENLDEKKWEFVKGDETRNVLPHLKRIVCDAHGGKRKRGHKLTYCFGNDSPVYYIQEFWEGDQDAGGSQQICNSQTNQVIFHESHDYWYQQGHNNTIYRENYLMRGGVHFSNPVENLTSTLSFLEKNDGSMSEWKILYCRFIEKMDYGIGGADEEEMLNKYFYFLLFTQDSQLINLCRVNAETDDGEVLKQFSSEFVPKRFFGNYESIFSFITENSCYDYEDQKVIRDSNFEKIEEILKMDIGDDEDEIQESVEEILRIFANSTETYLDLIVYKLKLHEILPLIEDNSLILMYLISIKVCLGFDLDLRKEVINCFEGNRRELVEDMVEEVVDKMKKNRNLFGRRIGERRGIRNL